MIEHIMLSQNSITPVRKLGMQGMYDCDRFSQNCIFSLYFKGISDSNNYDRMTCDVNILLMAPVHAHVIWKKTIKKDSAYSIIQ